MKLFSFIAVFAGLASSVAVSPARPEEHELEARAQLKKYPFSTCAVPRLTVNRREVYAPPRTGRRARVQCAASRQKSLAPWLQARNTDEASSSAHTLPPEPPVGVDKRKLQVWLRLDTRMPREGDFDNDKGCQHAELKEIIRQSGGQHTDVVIGGGGSADWVEYGLAFPDKEYRNTDNGNGCPVLIYADYMRQFSGAKWTFKGVINDDTILDPFAVPLTNAALPLVNRVYCTKTWNCRSFALAYLDELKPLLNSTYAQ